MKPRCTTSKTGRSIRIHAKEATLQRLRLRQRSKQWKQNYRAIRPKVERKIGHLMQRRHGGRRARVRGRDRVKADFSLLCAATNLERLAMLAVRYTGAAWAALAHTLAAFLLVIARRSPTCPVRAFSHRSPSPPAESPITETRHQLARFRRDRRPQPCLTPVS
ncbi:MAG: transposase [Phycisphaerae bacterium]